MGTAGLKGFIILEGRKGRELLDKWTAPKLKLFRNKHYQLTLVLIYSWPSIFMSFLILISDLIHLITIILSKYVINVFWFKYYEMLSAFEEDIGDHYLHCSDKDTESLCGHVEWGVEWRQFSCSAEPRASPRSHLIPSAPPKSLMSKRNNVSHLCNLNHSSSHIKNVI